MFAQSCSLIALVKSADKWVTSYFPHKQNVSFTEKCRASSDLRSCGGLP